MKRAYCQDCGKAFLREADETWKKLCVACFKKSKEPADTYWINRALSAESLAATLQSQVEQQRMTISQLAFRPATSSVERELAENWRALVQLVHPDKHGGSAGATRVSQWLNGLKGRLPCD